jgi:translation initiation factor IF-1
MIEGHIEAQGIILQKYNDRQFLVELNNGHQCKAQMSGKMVVNRIKVLTGDSVILHFNSYSLDICRIVRRL